MCASVCRVREQESKCGKTSTIGNLSGGYSLCYFSNFPLDLKLLNPIDSTDMYDMDESQQHYAGSKQPGAGTSLAVQWLGLGAFTALGPGSIPGWGTKKAARHKRLHIRHDSIQRAIWKRQSKADQWLPGDKTCRRSTGSSG